MGFWPDWNSQESMHAWRLAVPIVATILAALLVAGSTIVSERIFGRREERLRQERLQENIKTSTQETERKLEQAEAEQRRLGEELESERKRRERLEQQQKPRSLTEEQRRILVERLISLRGWSVMVVSANDVEAQEYARQLRSVLREAGIGAGEIGMRAVVGGPPELRGLVLRVADTNSIPFQMQKLAAALEAAGIPYQFQSYGQMEIFVGAKPLPAS